jgi:hypothetical protein
VIDCPLSEISERPVNAEWYSLCVENRAFLGLRNLDGFLIFGFHDNESVEEDSRIRDAVEVMQLFNQAYGAKREKDWLSLLRA